MKHVGMDLNAFRVLCKSHHHCSAFPSASVAGAASQQHEDSLESGLFTQQKQQQPSSQTTAASATHTASEQDKIKRVIKSVSVALWDQFVLQCKTNEVALELKKL